MYQLFLFNSVVDDKFVRDSVKFSNKTSSTFGQAFSDFTSPSKGKILVGPYPDRHEIFDILETEPPLVIDCREGNFWCSG